MSRQGTLTNQKPLDLWKIAESEVLKIKPQKLIKIQNNNRFTNRSFQQVFKNGQKTMKQLIPKSMSNVQTTKKNVPQSIKLLDVYAQKMGFLPMGQILQKPGSNYIGRTQQITQKGQKFYKQFPIMKDNFLDTPNLIQNFSFRANKTIQKWNQFVSAEADLATFLQAAQTSQGRKKLILNYAKTSSIGSDKLKILASLYYLYVQKKSSNFNYLNLQQTVIQQLKNILNSSGKIKAIYDQILSLLQDAKKNQSLYNKIVDYHNYKLKSLKASVSQSQFQQIKDDFQQQLAYVPDQMIRTPVIQQSGWLQTIRTSTGSSVLSSKIVTQQWEPKSQWFNPVNYLF